MTDKVTMGLVCILLFGMAQRECREAGLSAVEAWIASFLMVALGVFSATFAAHLL